MKTLLNLVTITFLSIFLISCSTDSSDDLSQTYDSNMIIPETKTFEIEIMELINAHRISLGLNTLQNNGVIKGQAYSHTEYMMLNNNISHDNFHSRSGYLINNFNASIVSENVAYGFTTAESVVNAWLNSPGHKVNIEGNYTYFDISAELDEDTNRWYFTNIFVKK